MTDYSFSVAITISIHFILHPSCWPAAAHVSPGQHLWVAHAWLQWRQGTLELGIVYCSLACNKCVRTAVEIPQSSEVNATLSAPSRRCTQCQCKLALEAWAMAHWLRCGPHLGWEAKTNRDAGRVAASEPGSMGRRSC
jgi:hypothetical protein